MCKLEILKACRHHIGHLSCHLPEESLCSLPTDLSLSFPGPFVKIQVAVALRSNKQELFDCRLEANRSGQFKVVCTDVLCCNVTGLPLHSVVWDK